MAQAMSGHVKSTDRWWFQSQIPVSSIPSLNPCHDNGGDDDDDYDDDDEKQISPTYCKIITVVYLVIFVLAVTNVLAI